MIVNLAPVKFTNVVAGNFDSNIPKSANSSHSQGRIVGIHVVASADVTCDIFFCKKQVDISADTIDQSNIFAWTSFASNIECPASLFHMGDELKVSYSTEKRLGDFYLLLKNTGGSNATFMVYLTIQI